MARSHGLTTSEGNRKGPDVTYPADPGGRFASDAHRRVMAHLPNPDDDPISIEDLIGQRINRDPHTLTHFTSVAEVAAVLDDLDADGHAKKLKSGWKNTAAGFELLTGPPDETALADAPATIGLAPAQLSSNGDA
jgi:hypothetical protein